MFERIVVVKKKTSLDALLERHYSRQQAAFYLKGRGSDIWEYDGEHTAYQASLATVLDALPDSIPRQMLQRADVPNFLFRDTDLVIVIGPDGLCANVAKYLPTQPMLTVNPDESRIDGKLMLFSPKDALATLPHVLKGKFNCRSLTLAQAQTNDGQTLLAVNDFLIGRRDHISARYTLQHGGKSERQSSSGILISTGVGSSGWLRSVLAGACALTGGTRQQIAGLPIPFDWEALRLAFVVREPFPSAYTGASVVSGSIEAGKEFTVVSEMTEGGVIFSDGVPEDALEFNAGCKLTISVAERTARLISGC